MSATVALATSAGRRGPLSAALGLGDARALLAALLAPSGLSGRLDAGLPGSEMSLPCEPSGALRLAEEASVLSRPGRRRRGRSSAAAVLAPADSEEPPPQPAEQKRREPRAPGQTPALAALGGGARKRSAPVLCATRMLRWGRAPFHSIFVAERFQFGFGRAEASSS